MDNISKLTSQSLSSLPRIADDRSAIPPWNPCLFSCNINIIISYFHDLEWLTCTVNICLAHKLVNLWIRANSGKVRVEGNVIWVWCKSVRPRTEVSICKFVCNELSRQWIDVVDYNLTGWIMRFSPFLNESLRLWGSIEKWPTNLHILIDEWHSLKN